MSFSFYADENLSYKLIGELRDFGYNVLRAYEAGNANQGIPDEQVLATATRLGRSVLTHNRQDFLGLHLSGVAHGGIIALKEDSDPFRICEFLDDHLTTEINLTNRFLRILARNQPGTQKPQLVMKEYLRS
jgi:hypothetical protein